MQAKWPFMQVTVTLETLSKAMRSIHETAAYIERYPESLLKGKSGG